MVAAVNGNVSGSLTISGPGGVASAQFSENITGSAPGRPFSLEGGHGHHHHHHRCDGSQQSDPCDGSAQSMINHGNQLVQQGQQDIQNGNMRKGMNEIQHGQDLINRGNQLAAQQQQCAPSSAQACSPGSSSGQSSNPLSMLLQPLEKGIAGLFGGGGGGGLAGLLGGGGGGGGLLSAAGPAMGALALL